MIRGSGRCWRGIISTARASWPSPGCGSWPGENLTYLGNLPLDDDDRQAAAYSETFGLGAASGRFDEALWQWRWDHEREAMIAENKAESEAFYALLERQRRSA